MSTITFTVPSFVKSPGTIADYAFCHGMQETFGKFTECVTMRDIDQDHMDKFTDAMLMVNAYIHGAHSDLQFDTDDMHDMAICYVEDNDLVNFEFDGTIEDWYAFVTDASEL